MNSSASRTRPTLSEALDAWGRILAEHKRPPELLWLFEENLCFEKSQVARGGFHFAFQTQFTPPPDEALDIAYEHFAATGVRTVFYRVGDCRGKSVCVLLCDPWFEAKGDAEGYIRRDDWGISFQPGADDELEEITELSRWLRRVKRRRRLHDLDFCMTLEAIEEIQTYGRPLLPYERFAQTMLKRLRRFLRQPA